MNRTKINVALTTEPQSQDILLKGWVRHFRSNRFLTLNDGSTMKVIQVVIDEEKTDEATINLLRTGAAVAVSGKLVPSQGKGQDVEVLAEHVEILGEADPEVYLLQPKTHSLEFLRKNAHLRMRTNTFAAIFKLRHGLAFAIHTFFNEKGFHYLHTPIITASDAEGAGEMFRVSTLSAENPPRTDDGSIDYSEDFFGKETNLTVSGQLEAECGALALGEVYTFGPTFRAENSNTTRHLAEFWMMEPEMAFYDLEDTMDLTEEFLKYLINYVLTHYPDELAFLDKRLANEEKQKPQNERSDMGLVEKLRFTVENDFERITYTKAIEVLRNSKPFKKKKFKFPVEWGTDLQSEHERFLVEKHFKKPVIVIDYPKDIKAFYMKSNPDGKTVAAMDVLAPGIGEIVGGAQREENYDKLVERMEAMDVPQEELWWYLDLRKFGSVPHSGFGLGFERMVQFVTGMGNIRDVIAFPRTPKSAEF